MWCDDDNIKPYFIEAGRKITYGNLRRQLLDSLEDRPFPELPDEFQKVLKNRNQIVKEFKEYGFTYVTMDLQGYRMGSMNETLKK